MVWPPAKVAAPPPALLTTRAQVHEPPTVVAPPTLLVLLTRRSGWAGAAWTTPVSLQALFVSLLSATRPFGSTAQAPPERGLANVPIAVGVTGTVTVKAPVVAPSVTLPPLAVQVRSLPTMEQLTLA